MCSDELDTDSDWCSHGICPFCWWRGIGFSFDKWKRLQNIRKVSTSATSRDQKGESRELRCCEVPVFDVCFGYKVLL